MNAPHDEDAEPEDNYVLPSVHRMTREEARQIFDENARYWLGMSGDEFLRKWRNREFGDVDNHPNHLRMMGVAMLLPLVDDDEGNTTMVTQHPEASASVKTLTQAEAAASFDRTARRYLGMSGNEFKRKWEAGEFGDMDRHPDHLLIERVAALLPWAEE